MNKKGKTLAICLFLGLGIGLFYLSTNPLIFLASISGGLGFGILIGRKI